MVEAVEAAIVETDFPLKRPFAAQKAVNKGVTPCPRHVSGLALHGPPLEVVLYSWRQTSHKLARKQVQTRSNFMEHRKFEGKFQQHFLLYIIVNF